MISRAKQIKFQQATNVVEFLLQLLNDNGETINRDDEYVKDIKPFSSYINWLEFCKFGMLFSRDSKIRHLDKDLLADAIKGKFEGLVLDGNPNKDNRTNVILADYGLNARLLHNMRSALMKYAVKRVPEVDRFVKELTEEERNEYLRNDDDIYSVLGYSEDKGYYSLRDDMTFDLLNGKILKVHVTNKQGITTNIIVYGDTISLDYTTKPIEFVSSLGKSVDLLQAFDVGEAELVSFVRNCIAHDNFVYSAENRTFTSGREIKGLRVVIPEGWLVQFANYFVTNTFLDVSGDRERDGKVIHGNNKFVLQFYPSHAPIDTIEQVYSMLNSRVRYQVIINDQSIRYQELRKAIQDVHAKIDKDIDNKRFDAIVAQTVKKAFGKLGIKDYTLERVNKPLTEDEKNFWSTYLSDVRMFFTDNLGVQQDKNNFMKHFTEYGVEDRVDEQNSNFGTMHIRLMAECFKLKDPKVLDYLEQIRGLSIDVPEEVEESYEKFMAYTKEHEPKVHQLYLDVNKIINAKVDQLFKQYGLRQGKAQKFFDQLVYMTEKDEKDCMECLQHEIAEKKRIYDEQYDEVNRQSILAIARVPIKHIRHVGNTTDLTRSSQSAIIKYLRENDPEGMRATELVGRIEADYKRAKRLNKLKKRYEKEKQELNDRFYERKMQIIKDVEESRGNNIGAITGKVDTHITGDTLLQLMDIFNRLGYHVDGTKADSKMCVNKNDLETMLVNRRDVVSALSVYQAYSALVMSGFMEKGNFLLDRDTIKLDFDNVALGGRYWGDMTFKKPGKDGELTLLEERAIEQQVQTLDLQGFEVKGIDRNKISQMGVNGKMYILYMIRSSLVHGNVKIADFYDYSGEAEEVKLQFGNNITCSTKDMIRVFSNPVFVGATRPQKATNRCMDTDDESQP